MKKEQSANCNLAAPPHNIKKKISHGREKDVYRTHKTIEKLFTLAYAGRNVYPEDMRIERNP